MNIPEGYEILAEGICTFSDSPKYYLGYWYHNEEVDIYYFVLTRDEDDEDDEEDDKEPEIYPVEEENMVYDDAEVFGWFSKTMEEYTFAVLPESEDEEDPEDPPEGSFWQSLQQGAEGSEDDNEYIPSDKEDEQEGGPSSRG